VHLEGEKEHQKVIPMVGVKVLMTGMNLVLQTVPVTATD
jgi:hypothetical protein